jgi:hypothetical protein
VNLAQIFWKPRESPVPSSSGSCPTGSVEPIARSSTRFRRLTKSKMHVSREEGRDDADEDEKAAHSGIAKTRRSAEIWMSSRSSFG